MLYKYKFSIISIDEWRVNTYPYTSVVDDSDREADEEGEEENASAYRKPEFKVIFLLFSKLFYLCNLLIVSLHF